MNDDIFDPKNRAKLKAEAEAEKKVAEERIEAEKKRLKDLKKSDLETKIRLLESQIHTAEFREGGFKREIQALGRKADTLESNQMGSSSGIRSGRAMAQLQQSERNLKAIVTELHKLELEETQVKNQILASENEIARKDKERNERVHGKGELNKTEAAKLKRELWREALKETEEKRKIEKLKRELEAEERALEKTEQEIKADHTKYDELEREKKTTEVTKPQSSSNDYQLKTKKLSLQNIERKKQDLEHKRQLLEQNLNLERIEVERETRQASQNRRGSDITSSRMRGRSADLEMTERSLENLRRQLAELKNELAKVR
ncbi:MAG TPA: hypothetical protein VJK09_02705 [Candidatus Paceibacterota bacterium]